MAMTCPSARPAEGVDPGDCARILCALSPLQCDQSVFTVWICPLNTRSPEVFALASADLVQATLTLHVEAYLRGSLCPQRDTYTPISMFQGIHLLAPLMAALWWPEGIDAAPMQSQQSRRSRTVLGLHRGGVMCSTRGVNVRPACCHHEYHFERTAAWSASQNS